MFYCRLLRTCGTSIAVAVHSLNPSLFTRVVVPLVKQSQQLGLCTFQQIWNRESTRRNNDTAPAINRTEFKRISITQHGVTQSSQEKDSCYGS